MLHLDGSPIRDPILGWGRSGVVVQRDGTAIKLPLKDSTSGDSEDQERSEINTEMSCESIEHEKMVYQRLGDCDGVVRFLDLSGPGIQMVLMEHRNLRDYLAQHRTTKTLQLSWFREMARSLARIHNRHVIVADIAARNFLLAADLSIKFSDFTESTILPLDADMRTADDAGYSIHTDIGQLGAVMYEVITGQQCQFDLFEGLPPGPAIARWPRRQSLPETQNIWLGAVIEKCWTRSEFQDGSELLAALDLVTFDSASDNITSHNMFDYSLPQITVFMLSVATFSSIAFLLLRRSNLSTVS